jgi:hypothetical protein
MLAELGVRRSREDHWKSLGVHIHIHRYWGSGLDYGYYDGCFARFGNVRGRQGALEQLSLCLLVIVRPKNSTVEKDGKTKRELIGAGVT